MIVPDVAGNLRYRSTVKKLVIEALSDALVRQKALPDFHWSAEHVRTLWAALYAREDIGWVLIRREWHLEDLERVAYHMEETSASDGLTTCVPAHGLYDGLNRIAAVCMVGYGFQVRQAKTNAPIRWRLAFDPLTETFHILTAQVRKDYPAVLTDISRLFDVPWGGSADAVLDKHASVMRRLGLSPDAMQRADASLRRLLACLDETPINVLEMPATVSDLRARQATVGSDGTLGFAGQRKSLIDA